MASADAATVPCLFQADAAAVHGDIYDIQYLFLIYLSFSLFSNKFTLYSNLSRKAMSS